MSSLQDLYKELKSLSPWKHGVIHVYIHQKSLDKSMNRQQAIDAAVRKFPTALAAAKECWHYAQMDTRYPPEVVYDRQMRGYLEDEMFATNPNPLDKIRVEFLRIVEIGH